MSRSSGQGLVEFALVLPIFVLLLLMVFDGGRLIFQNNQIQNIAVTAIRETMVRDWPPVCAGITDRTPCVQAIVARDSVAMSQPPTVSLVDCGLCKLGSKYTVTVDAHVTFITPVIGNILGEWDISATHFAFIESLPPPP